VSLDLVTGSTVVWLLTIAFAVINSIKRPDDADGYVTEAFVSTVIWASLVVPIGSTLGVWMGVVYAALMVLFTLELLSFKDIMRDEWYWRWRSEEVSGIGKGSCEADY